MRGEASYCLYGLIGVAVVAAITATWLPVLGIASSALLFLLPVLMVSVRGGIGPAILTAASGALAYNYFLLPPRYTFRVHGFDNLVSVFVLFAVAVVTSRLATALKIREAEAAARAAASAQSAQFSALLGRGNAVDGALAWLTEEFDDARILLLDSVPGEGNGFSMLDLSAAAWAMHNGDLTGHGSAIMPAADWTFLPLSPHRQAGTDLLAIARPSNGETRDETALAQLLGLARQLGQARDRSALEQERLTRDRLEDRDAFRRTLLASLAHDFRTPLTVVTGELAKLAEVDSGAASALAEARRLDRMMDDLVGAARIESGALKPHIEAVDLVDIVSDAVASLGALPGAARLERAIAADLPLVDADPVLLRHILINLLDNAMRHATCIVSVSAQVHDNAVMLVVTDDGPGIAEPERARIFERFTRIEGDDRSGGSGLGLAIVKGFADAMDMKISVNASEVGGAVFCLSLRLHAASMP